MTPEILNLPDRRLAYHKIGGREPGVMFLGGFFSDMTGTKAGYLAERCAAAGQGFLRFDYRGHGQSSGDFADGTIGDWLDDALVVFDQLTNGPQILVGSSMGGWIALLLALRRPERVQAVVGVAAAPDFTEDLMWAQLTPEQKNIIHHDGLLLEASDHADQSMPITLRLIEEGRDHLLLREPIKLRCPLRLLQGERDAEVPPHWPEKIAAQVASGDVRIHMIAEGDHRLSRPQDMELLWSEICALV
jgi:pimeloyl-ACP methyl ester carboxylesterase